MTRRTQAQWQTIIEQYVQSGLTPRKFCAQQNIHLQTFYSRRHRLMPSWLKMTSWRYKGSPCWHLAVINCAMMLGVA